MKLKRLGIVVLFFLSIMAKKPTLYAQEPVSFESEKIAAETFNKSNNIEARVLACVYFIDRFLDLEKLDSCQFWINKGMTVLKSGQFTSMSYLLQTRQTEIYYYSQLLKMGHISNQQSLKIAAVLGDSLCLADANHFQVYYLWQKEIFKRPYPGLSKPTYTFNTKATTPSHLT